MAARQQVTDMLMRAAAGEAGALDEAFPLVYDELRRLAHRQLRREQAGHTLNTTALVHEAYMRVADQRQAAWQSRDQFLAVAAMAMRRILVDHARRRGAAKRGSGATPVPLDRAGQLPIAERPDLIVALDEALDRLARVDSRQAKLVEYRFFAGLTEEETARLLGVGVRTARRDWARARIWLSREIHTVTDAAPP
jgi:RNA polymerase sigma factor (TIGR02999 family)